MSRGAMMTLGCGTYSDSIFDIVLALNKTGWVFKDDKMRYLSENDDDCSDWTTGVLSLEKLSHVFAQKQKRGQYAGVMLYHNESDAGIVLRAKNTDNICLDLDINRKKLNDKYTDMSWYIMNIPAKLDELGCKIELVEISEF